MGSEPWNRNAGKFDVPSSSLPGGRFVGSGSARRFEPSPEALRDYGAEAIERAQPGVFARGFVILETIDPGLVRLIEPASEPVVTPKRYSDRPGKRLRKGGA